MWPNQDLTQHSLIAKTLTARDFRDTGAATPPDLSIVQSVHDVVLGRYVFSAGLMDDSLDWFGKIKTSSFLPYWAHHHLINLHMRRSRK